MKRFVSLFVQALNGYLLVASLLVSCTHIQLPHALYPKDELPSPPTRGAALPETSTIPPTKGAVETPENFSSSDQVQYGTASWYGRPFHGRRTANGETYDMYEVTAAHRTAPLGTYAVVTNLNNGQAVQVRINDRGPAKRHRILDLSYGAAREIGMVTAGLARVKVEFLASQATAPARTLPIPPMLVASVGTVHAALESELRAPVAPYMMPASTRLPAPEVKSAPQTLTAAPAKAQMAWLGDSASPWPQEHFGAFSSRADPGPNALQYVDASYTLAARAAARSPGMVYSHGAG